MKVVVERVKNASCTVNNHCISKIDKGLLLLIGLAKGDTKEDVEKLAKKISKLRIFEDKNQKLNLNIKQVNQAILSISQFTLLADTKKGNRPSFTDAMPPKKAQELYRFFNKLLRDTYKIPTQAGVFGEYMDITLTNDGPVTLILEENHD
ncbi:MAG: D-tyrosyl-tRNA(Tyr) deacylase [Candidatus Izimaplasma sp.]|nr:D-tyrosyl-tRNA(Tyr) deacylase [Candidatus Izimaplasma bacterium]